MSALERHRLADRRVARRPAERSSVLVRVLLVVAARLQCSPSAALGPHRIEPLSRTDNPARCPYRPVVTSAVLVRKDSRYSARAVSIRYGSVNGIETRSSIMTPM